MSLRTSAYKRGPHKSHRLLCFDDVEIFSKAWKVVLSCTEQESTKEVGLGEALTVKPIVTSSVSLRIYPDFKPSSPKTPSRPPLVPGDKSVSLNIICDY